MSIQSKIATTMGLLVIGIPVYVALEVLGSAGAVWGTTDTAQLRKKESDNVHVRGICVFIICAATYRTCAKLYYTEPKPQRHIGSFMYMFNHAVISPLEAIKDEFFAPSFSYNEINDS